jgi:ATP-dependent DNA helicase RecQ
MTPESALHEIFGLPGFRPGQREVVDAVLSGRPTVAVMPTGAGKSLCYQLPAVVAGGTALVISPLIALMKDQVDGLTARGVPAAAITSALDPGEVGARLDDMAEGRLRLVYVAPERFRSPRFLAALARVGPRLGLMAVDEAHCISEWGHDFRPDYLRLGEAIKTLSPPRLVALTATATPEVRRDIARQLGMVDPVVIVRGFDRPNLRFAVERVRGGADKSARLVDRVRARSGAALVYAATRKNAEAYAAELNGARVRAAVYHAGLEAEARAQVQDRFMGGKLEVIVATNAFGMGVDKADVRLVVHADLPRSPEAYYQEAGRGGRDGDPADCVLLFAPGDVRLQEFLIDTSCPSVEVLRGLWRALRDDPRKGARLEGLGKGLPGAPSDAVVEAAARYLARAGYLRDSDGIYEALRPGVDFDAPPPVPIDPEALAMRARVERDKLSHMVGYAYATTCRRRYLLAYFGDEDARAMSTCAGCDVCSGEGRRSLADDEAQAVRTALSLIGRLRGRFGRMRVAGVLAGTDDDERLLELVERGATRRQGLRWTLDLLRSMESVGLIVASAGEYPTLHLGSPGKQVLAGGDVPALALPEAGAAPRRRKASGSEPDGRGDGSDGGARKKRRPPPWIKRRA